jgi:hypothetical protein
VARLGVPFTIVDNDLIPFLLEVAKRIAALNAAIGWPADASIAPADRARVRTQVAREFFPAGAWPGAGQCPWALVSLYSSARPRACDQMEDDAHPEVLIPCSRRGLAIPSRVNPRGLS